MTEARITDPAAIRAYLEGGTAHFTLVSRRTGARHTYRARRGDRALLLDHLEGPDNEASYRYIGAWTLRGFAPARTNSGLSPGQTAIAWFLRALYDGRPLDDVEVWRAGRCSKCGSLLTTPESIERGLGPVCAAQGQGA